MIRLDQALVERGLCDSRERAKRAILAGQVRINGQLANKPSDSVKEADELSIEAGEKFVSRGGQKLERALEHWKVDVGGRVSLDVGTSTGGFTDCLLQHGAARVIAVDTGRGQIALRLRDDPRVRLLENTNARYLTRDELGEVVDLIAIDVSFISVTLVLPAVAAAAFPEDRREWAGRQVVILVKPQFEVGRERIRKGGIVRDREAQQDAVEKVRSRVQEFNPRLIDVTESPILGAEGNREFLLYAEF